MGIAAAIDETGEERLEAQRTFAGEEVTSTVPVPEPAVEVLEMNMADGVARPEPFGRDALVELTVEAQKLGVERDLATGIALQREPQVRERRSRDAGNRLDGEHHAVRLRGVQAGGEAIEVALELTVAVGPLPEMEHERLGTERGGGATVHLERRERLVGLVAVVTCEPYADRLVRMHGGKRQP